MEYVTPKKIQTLNDMLNEHQKQLQVQVSKLHIQCNLDLVT